MTRGKGRSTSQALEALAEAIRFPGEWVEYTDHAQHYEPTACQYWASELRSIVKVLGLKQVTVDYSLITGRISIKSDWEGI